MCFSATASFTSGAILSTIGVISIKKAKEPSDIPFASIPLIFAIQQICEGFLWLALTNPDYAFLEDFSTYTFLVFAQVIWPFWVPFSIFKFNKYKNSNFWKYISIALIGLGAFVSLALLYHLIYYPVNGEVLGSHINYNQDYPEKYRVLGGFLYVIVTIVPIFLHRNIRMTILGLAILLSYIITEIFYDQYIVSVWCFFAAILSIIVLWVISGKKPK